MAWRKVDQKFLIFTSALVLLYFVQCSTAIPRGILKAQNSNSSASLSKLRKVVGSSREEVRDVRIHDRTIQIQPIITGITNMITCITNAFSGIIGNVTGGLKDGLGNLTSLFMKPSGGGGLFGELKNLTSSLKPDVGGGLGGLFNKNTTIGGGCNLIDPLLVANIPGIFFWTPLVILGIAILVGCIAAIIIAIGGLGSHITDGINEMIKEKMKQGQGGYEDSSSYGDPSSSYGSTGSSYSRFTQTMDQLTNDFSQAYDKYSAMSQQPQAQQQNSYQQQQSQQVQANPDQNQQQIFKEYYENQSQYDQWNQVAKARKG